MRSEAPLKTIQRVVKIKKLSSLAHRYRGENDEWKEGKRQVAEYQMKSSARKKREHDRKICLIFSTSPGVVSRSKKNESWES
jgi:hypothetical protein